VELASAGRAPRADRPNGAGKTTLFNLIAGVLPASAGRITLFDDDVTAWPSTGGPPSASPAPSRSPICFPSLSVLDNVRLAAQALTRAKFAMLRPLTRFPRAGGARPRGAGRRRAGGPRRGHGTHLSHGEQRQLEIAMALAGRPRVLLLDEPAAGLSQAEAHLMTALLRRLDPAITLLIIEHDMDIALEVAQQVTVLHYGKVIADARATRSRPIPRARDLPRCLSRPRRCWPWATPYLLRREPRPARRVARRGAGEVVAILGRNGMGKTTLIRSVVGFSPPRRGRVRFRSHDVTAWPPFRRVERGMALVPQGRRVFASLSVRENLDVARRERRWSWRSLRPLPRLASAPRAAPTSSRAASSRCWPSGARS